VAAHLETEILLVDEVLAVGDAEFQKKCLGKIGEVTTGGRTAILVSHNLGAISSICTSALLLERGHLQASGSVEQSLAEYERLHGAPTGALIDLSQLAHFGDPVEARSVHLRTLRFLAGSAIHTEGASLLLEIEVTCEAPQQLSFGLGLVAPDGSPVAVGFTDEVGVERGCTIVHLAMHELDLVPADYRISLSVGLGSCKGGSLHDVDGVEHAGTLHVVPGDDGTKHWSRVWGWRRHEALAVRVLSSNAKSAQEQART
jgi:lipopolysaccharide transport system ATP-binding protein